uniref:Bloodthirsty-related gene family, member 7 n=1 Tax=Salarias fasciatus TaxID=181472 RepID=A0A672GTV6_SALFA
MAAAGAVLSREQLLCPICLDLFNQPVSTPCGHNFCRECINRYWQSAYLLQCPMCKHKLYKKPDLKVNAFISEVASQFKELMKRKDEPDATSQGDVSCDVCAGKKIQALKSCLDCLASFCETHLEPHLVLGTLKTHQLIRPMMNMQDRVCQKHEKLLSLFCKTDQMFVCQMCIKRDHTAHRTIHIEEESREKRDEIKSISAELEGMIHSRLQKVCSISQTVELSKRNTEKEFEESLDVFDKLLQLVQRGQAEVAEVLSAKQRQVEEKASRLIAELEREIDQLGHAVDELKQLTHTDDHLYLLRRFPALSAVPAVRDWSGVCSESVEYVGTVRRAVRRVACQLEEAATAEAKRLCETELERARRYAVDVTYDPDTAHPKLVLSESNKQVHHSDVALDLPDNPERFYPGVSVLGKEGFSSGKFYFEVQVKGKTEWDIGVGLESVNRKGGGVLNPEKGFWALGMRRDGSYWALGSPPIRVPLVEKPQRLGVYADLECGQVSFYNSDSHSHIYTFTGYCFTGRLFPYFNPRRNHGGVNSDPLVILPLL